MASIEVNYKVNEIIQVFSHANSSFKNDLFLHKYIIVEKDTVRHAKIGEKYSSIQELTQFVEGVNKSLSKVSNEFLSLRFEFDSYKCLSCNPAKELVSVYLIRKNLSFLCAFPFHELMDHPALTEKIITDSFAKMVKNVLHLSYYINGSKNYVVNAERLKYCISNAFNFCLSQIAEKVEGHSLDFEKAYFLFKTTFFEAIHEYTKLHPPGNLNDEDSIWNNGDAYEIEIESVKKSLSTQPFLLRDGELIIADIIYSNNFKKLLFRFFTQIKSGAYKDSPKLKDENKENIAPNEPTGNQKQVRFRV